MKYKKFLKYLFFVLLIGVLGFLCGFSSVRNLDKNPRKIIVEFEGENTNFLTHKMVDKLLIQNKKSVKKIKKSVLDLYGLESQINKNPYVEKSSVFLHIDGTIKSIIQQRNPIARIVAKDTSYYVDEKGVKIPLSDSYAARVLLVLGVHTKNDLKKVVRFVSIISKDDFLKKEIIGISKSDNEEYQLMVRSGNYKIDFGKLENIDIKFKKLKAFYNKTFLDKTIQDYKLINVKFHNQVVCTK